MNKYTEKIPQELKNLKQWGNYKKIWVPERKKYTKIPLNSWDGSPGKSNDPSTWSDFETALRGLEKNKEADGLAFYFANGYVGLDIDHIKDELDSFGEGGPSELLSTIREMTKNSYLEISLSGEGIHVLFKGKIPGKHRRKGNFEMYESGRFFALTANTIQSTPTIESLSQDEMKKLFKFIFGEDKVIPITKNASPIKPVDLSIREIIEKAENSRTGKRFKLFMSGGWEEFYNSQSEADMAFANDLAFWCGKDFTKMDTIFRNSSLIREKYDEKRGATTYGKALLNKAINETSEVYSPKNDDEGLNYDLSFMDSQQEVVHHSMDDMGNAQRFLDAFPDKFLYSYTDKKWFDYTGSHWEEDTKGVVYQAADLIPQRMLKENLVLPDSLSEKEAQKAQDKWAKFISKTRNNSAKKNMLEEVKHHVSVGHGDFDKDNMLLNTASGYVDLTTGELHDHDVKRRFSMETAAEYSSATDCPRWIEFLNQIFDGDQELIHYIQKAFGYMITGSITEQVMFVFYGAGRNGKSVLTSIIQDILGSYAKTINVSNLMVQRGNSGPNSEIARLENARLVVTNEANEGDRLDESLIKQLTGGDRIVSRFLYGQEFEFTPRFKLLMVTNHKPNIYGTDDGIWRRMVMIPFNVQIPKDKIDKKLKYKLQAEAAGILNWIVEGCLMWQSEGLEPPQSVKREVTEYRNEMDEIAEFIEEKCEVNPQFEVKSSELYQAYKDWALSTSHHVFSSTTFGKKMADKFSKKHKRDGEYRQGIKLKEPYSGLNDLL